ncbi:helix-turn-helix transcriptional regulator [Plantactinospora solaniradicis]|uniref:Helix-turn-helix transcriptional regulator n=1 Tax=Plantactinospora solaniradicis TaxID=1723736 RepID=A0ABW1K9V6_9ACTN
MSVRRPSLATTTEVAEYIQKPPRTLEQWRYRGAGPRWIKLANREVRYRWTDVEKWLDDQYAAAA